MKLSKKKILALAIAVCLLATLSMGTLAWFSDKDSVTNNFYVAGSEDQNPDKVFSVDVWEDKTPDDNGEDKIQDGIKFDAILPGDKLFKEVHIENTGAYPQYIRATVTVTEAAIWQDVYGMRIVPLEKITNADLSGVHTQVAYYDAANDAFIYELYYTNVLEVGKDIVVFDTVSINENLNREQAAEMQNFEIKVVATAVQTEHVGTNVFEAFKTVGMVKAAPISDPAELAAALASEEEAYIIVDTAALTNDTMVISSAIKNKTIDFNGQNAKIQFASGSSAENIVVSGIVDTDGEGFSFETADDFTGDVTVINCDFTDLSTRPLGAVRPAGGDITFENCSFKGIGKSYGIRTDHRTGDLTIKNCYFETLGSWAIIVNGTNTGNLTVEGCTFKTEKGVLKTLGGGVTEDFTFTNNTLIGVKGDDASGTKIVVSGSNNGPIIVAGTKTVTGNTLDGADWGF